MSKLTEVIENIQEWALQVMEENRVGQADGETQGNEEHAVQESAGPAAEQTLPAQLASPLPTVSLPEEGELPGGQTIEAVPSPAAETAAQTLVPSPSPAVEETTSGGGMWLWMGLGVIVVLAAVAVGWALFRRKSRRSGPTVPAGETGGGLSVGKLHQQGARSSQQDCFSVSDPSVMAQKGLLAVVADGMGGLEQGDKVSQTAVEAAMNGFYLADAQGEQLLLYLLEQANQAVNAFLGPDRQKKSGSTLVMGLIQQGRFYSLSVGDSRICLYRDGQLYQLNREHIFRHELALRAVNQEGSFQDAWTNSQASGLTSFLGMGKLKYVDLPAQPVTVLPGDRFILMSDGVYNAVTEPELTAALDLPTGEEAAQAIGQCIQGKRFAKQDNYTAVILAC